MNAFIANNAALPNTPPAGLELRLDKSEDVYIRSRHAGNSRKEQAKGNKRSVDGGEIDGNRKRVEITGVGPFHDDHTGVTSQPPMELAVAHVDGIDARRAPLKKAIGKASC
jgi:hypothetical protein